MRSHGQMRRRLGGRQRRCSEGAGLGLIVVLRVQGTRFEPQELSCQPHDDLAHDLFARGLVQASLFHSPAMNDESRGTSTRDRLDATQWDDVVLASSRAIVEVLSGRYVVDHDVHGIEGIDKAGDAGLQLDLGEAIVDEVHGIDNP
jgi:hypothetical protein